MSPAQREQRVRGVLVATELLQELDLQRQRRDLVRRTGVERRVCLLQRFLRAVERGLRAGERPVGRAVAGDETSRENVGAEHAVRRRGAPGAAPSRPPRRAGRARGRRRRGAGPPARRAGAHDIAPGPRPAIADLRVPRLRDPPSVLACDRLRRAAAGCDPRAARPGRDPAARGQGWRAPRGRRLRHGRRRPPARRAPRAPTYLPPAGRCSKASDGLREAVLTGERRAQGEVELGDRIRKAPAHRAARSGGELRPRRRSAGSSASDSLRVGSRWPTMSRVSR